MPKLTPYDELVKTFKLVKQEDETFEHFAERATNRVNKCSDAQWKELDNILQVWVNETLQARETSVDLPPLVGWPEGEETSAEPESDDDAATSGGIADGEPSGSEETGDPVDDQDAAPVEETVDEPDNSGQEEHSEETPTVRRRPSRPAAAAKTVSAPSSKTKPKPNTGKAKVMAAKPKVAPKPAKKAAAANGGGGGRIGEKDTIKLVAKENPYRDGSLGHKVFAKYKEGMTVAAFAKAITSVGTERPANALLRFDINKGYVKVVAAD